MRPGSRSEEEDLLSQGPSEILEDTGEEASRSVGRLAEGAGGLEPLVKLLTVAWHVVRCV